MNISLRYAADAGNMNLNNYYVFAGASSQLSEGNSSDLYTGLEYLYNDDDEFRDLGYLKKEKDDIQGKELFEGLQWLGVSNQFFSTNIFIEKPYETKIWAERYDDGSGGGVRAIAALGFLISAKRVILRGGTMKFSGAERLSNVKGHGRRKKQNCWI